jgi:hypothetical protein
MGYSHGISWNEKLIEKTLIGIVEKNKLKTFPTHKQMNEITGSMALTNAVSRHGGTRYWANKLGLEIKPCESKLGEDYEFKCMEFIKHLGYRCEKMPVRYPYDLLVENNIKVDVKCGNLYKGAAGEYYTFNLEKKKPTCDLFVCFCLNNDRVEKVFVIPSCELSGKTQLSVGKIKSTYDKYIEEWDYLHLYDVFYDSLRKGC